MPPDDLAVGAWSALGLPAKLFRVAHAAAAIVNMSALGYVWLSAAKRRRDRWLAVSIAALLAEGGALVVGRGNCPLGPFQRSLGDPVPLFELVLPPRAAKAAIPFLAVVTFAGFAAVLVRGRAQAASEFGASLRHDVTA